MPRIFKIEALKERKRALLQESEVYRETLKLEVNNLRLYALRTQRKFSSLSGLNPLLMLLGPFALNVAGKRTLPKMRWLSMGLFAWKMFKRARSVSLFFLRRRKRNQDTESHKQSARAE